MVLAYPYFKHSQYMINDLTLIFEEAGLCKMRLIIGKARSMPYFGDSKIVYSDVFLPDLEYLVNMD